MTAGDDPASTNETDLGEMLELLGQLDQLCKAYRKDERKFRDDAENLQLQVIKLDRIAREATEDADLVEKTFWNHRQRCIAMGLIQRGEGDPPIDTDTENTTSPNTEDTPPQPEDPDKQEEQQP
jgi:hypothetical protein